MLFFLLVFFFQILLHLYFSTSLGSQDSALIRPGRLDRIVYVGPPDQKAREEILMIRTRSMSVEPGCDMAEIARIVSLSLGFIDHF
jgi:ATP-dependent 26S proteasome regulatory subunit